jgi:alpha-L-rhamnosidase
MTCRASAGRGAVAITGQAHERESSQRLRKEMNRTRLFQIRCALVSLALPVVSFIPMSVRAYSQLALTTTSSPSQIGSKSTNPAGDALRSGFLNPPPSARLRCYWWWLNGHVTTESIDHDLTEMKAKGYGGVLLVDANGADADGNNPVPAGPTFGSPEWTELFLHAAKTARRLGLEITLTITSGWDLGAPFIQPKDAIKVLTWTRTAAGNRETTLPEPSPKHAFYERIAVLAYPLRHGPPLAGEDGDARAPRTNLKQKSAAAETGGSMPASADLLFDRSGSAGDEDAEVSDVRDVTRYVDAHDVLHWTAPTPGPWEILNVGYTNSGVRLSPGSGAWQGLSLDTLSPSALNLYWDKELVPLLNAARPYLGNTIKYVTTDSWEMGGMNWTQNYRDEFIKRRGYDPVPYLPIVAGRILTSREVSDEFLADLRRTVGDLINLHFDTMAVRAAHFGLGVECESGGPHGEPVDALETFRHSAVPQTEFWAMSKSHRSALADRYFVKEAASAAHIYGRPLVADEGETSMGNHWTESIGMDLKPSFDMALTEGMNRLVWHQFASSPAEMGLPGQEYFAGTYLNTKVTWWQQAGAFTAYLNRGQYMMQRGQPVADVLYYYGDQVPNFVRLKSDDPAGVLPGYDYDATDTEALLHRMVIDASGLHTPEGIHYRMLVLPPWRVVPLAVLEFVDRYLKAGGVVVGERPLRPQGNIPALQQREYQQLANKIWSGYSSPSPESPVHVSRGLLFCEAKGRDALGALHILPDFVAESPAVDYIHRHSASNEIYFVRNGQPDTVTTSLTFRVAGQEPEIFDSATGNEVPLALYEHTNDGRTRLSVSLAPYEAYFVVFSGHDQAHLTRLTHDGQEVPISDRTMVVAEDGRLQLQTTIPGDYIATRSDGRETRLHVPNSAPQPITSGWTLDFPPNWGAPAHVNIPRLKSWTEFDDPGVRYFSGTAAYHTTLHIDAAQLAPGRELWLDLGSVYEVASIRVNGTTLAPLWKHPYAARIDGCLHPGDNALEVDVTNLWPNRLIGDAQPSVTHRVTWTNITAFTASSPLLLSGLLGPVTLNTVYTQCIEFAKSSNGLCSNSQ